MLRQRRSSGSGKRNDIVSGASRIRTYRDTAIRIVFWFENDRLVVALVGFNKAKLGDVWYSSAAVRAEALVDQWRRTHHDGLEGAT